MNDVYAFVVPLLLSIVASLMIGMITVGWFFVKRIVERFDNEDKEKEETAKDVAEFRTGVRKDIVIIKSAISRVERNTEKALEAAGRIDTIEEDVSRLKRRIIDFGTH